MNHHYIENTVSWPSYLCNRNTYNGKSLNIETGTWVTIHKDGVLLIWEVHCGYKTFLWLSYLPNGISYFGKVSLCWIRALHTLNTKRWHKINISLHYFFNIIQHMKNYLPGKRRYIVTETKSQEMRFGGALEIALVRTEKWKTKQEAY